MVAPHTTMSGQPLQTQIVSVQHGQLQPGDPNIHHGTGHYRQLIVTDNKSHVGIAGGQPTSGLTLPQKPTPPVITLAKPAATVITGAGDKKQLGAPVSTKEC